MDQFKRIRAAGVVIKDDKVLLIHRVNRGDDYYTLPGGGVSSTETPGDACFREILQMASIRVHVNKQILQIDWDDNSSHIVFLCDYISGKPAVMKDSPEYKHMQGPVKNQSFEPMWVPIAKWRDLPIYPLEIRDIVFQDIEAGFPEGPRNFMFKVSERRG
jgi:hypothetical protein